MQGTDPQSNELDSEVVNNESTDRNNNEPVKEQVPPQVSPADDLIDKAYSTHIKPTDALLGVVAVAMLALFVVTNVSQKTFANINALALVSEAPIGEMKAKSLTWSPSNLSAPWGRRDSHMAYVFKDELYLGGGLDATGTGTSDDNPVYEKAVYYDDIWKTKDGINWEKITDNSDLPKLRSASVVEFNGALYLYAGWGPDIGFNTQIWKSTNGVNWSVVATSTPMPAREGQRVLLANGRLYMFAGVNYFIRKDFNDVWESDDAIHWHALTTNAPWSGRWDDDVAYHRGKFWLAGGMNLKHEGFNDVWYSEDGANWSLALQHAPWSERQGQVLLSKDGILYLFGGLGASSNAGVGDTWFTKDGFNWQRTNTDGYWIGREDHQVLPFKDKFVLFGGMGSDWHWQNDVWIGDFQ